MFGRSVRYMIDLLLFTIDRIALPGTYNRVALQDESSDTVQVSDTTMLIRDPNASNKKTFV